MFFLHSGYSELFSRQFSQWKVQNTKAQTPPSKRQFPCRRSDFSRDKTELKEIEKTGLAASILRISKDGAMGENMSESMPQISTIPGKYINTYKKKIYIYIK